VSQAIEAYERSLELERQIGNRDMVAAILGDLAYEYLMAGNPRAASRHLDEMEPLATGKLAAQAEKFRALQQLSQGDLASARAHLEHVREAFFGTGHSRGVELKFLGDVLMAQRELAQARARYEQFLARGWPKGSSWHVDGLVALSQLSLEEGDTRSAEAVAREAIALCERSKNAADAANAQVALARALLSQQRFEEASAAAELALTLAARNESTPISIHARIALSRARIALRPREAKAALAELQSALDQANELGLVGEAYAARLAAGEIALRLHPNVGRMRLRELARDA